ncbi:hypothetical protein HPB51_021226 [Rhipicephalus microplus]|uniref:Peptidase M13 N-terminal domain-containing protein n=1 Tax=Rhipicephalus microplus TaxID=6941 RepID=A0A9J6F5W3_RHIMP|nr:hypothetical protein HPB51_021226 [Rhipicephalus microplus]
MRVQQDSGARVLFFVVSKNVASHGRKVFNGAATCTFAFVGYDLVAQTATETAHRFRVVPSAVSLVFLLSLLGCFSSSVAVTLLSPHSQLGGSAPLLQAPFIRGLPGLLWVLGFGSLCWSRIGHCRVAARSGRAPRFTLGRRPPMRTNRGQQAGLPSLAAFWSRSSPSTAASVLALRYGLIDHLPLELGDLSRDSSATMHRGGGCIVDGFVDDPSLRSSTVAVGNGGGYGSFQRRTWSVELVNQGYCYLAVGRRWRLLLQAVLDAFAVRCVRRAFALLGAADSGVGVRDGGAHVSCGSAYGACAARGERRRGALVARSACDGSAGRCARAHGHRPAAAAAWCPIGGPQRRAMRASAALVRAVDGRTLVRVPALHRLACFPRMAAARRRSRDSNPRPAGQQPSTLATRPPRRGKGGWVEVAPEGRTASDEGPAWNNRGQTTPSSTTPARSSLLKAKLPAPPEVLQCNTSACLDFSARTTQLLREAINPCGDFYKYACDSWQHDHALRRQAHYVSTDTVYLKQYVNMLKKALFKPGAIPKLGFLYQVCKKVTTDTLYSRLLSTFLYTLNIGSWPYSMASSRNIPVEDLSYKIGVLKRELGLDSIFRVGSRRRPRQRVPNHRVRGATKAARRAGLHDLLESPMARQGVPFTHPERGQERHSLQWYLEAGAQTAELHGRGAARVLV